MMLKMFQSITMRQLVLGFAIALLSGGLLISDALAYPSLFTSRCASCHSDDTTSCNGCHRHRGSLSASADQDAYAPGELVTVTLNGGQQMGWIRGLLYDDGNVEIDRATGPTGTGDDGLGNPVTFPVTLQASAPDEPGLHTWEAAWYGSVNSGGGNHTEQRVSVTIMVEDIISAVPGEDEPEFLTWSQIKAAYR